MKEFKMIVNIKEIKEFILDTKTSAYELEKHISLTRTAIARYRNGEADIMNMTLVKALAIQEYINKDK